jgi:hypothetical protein
MALSNKINKWQHRTITIINDFKIISASFLVFFAKKIANGDHPGRFEQFFRLKNP